MPRALPPPLPRPSNGKQVKWDEVAPYLRLVDHPSSKDSGNGETLVDTAQTLPNNEPVPAMDSFPVWAGVWEAIMDIADDDDDGFDD